MTLQVSTTFRAPRDLINPDKLLLRPPTTLTGPEAPFQFCLEPSAPSQAMLGDSQPPAQPQTWHCLVKEPHHLDPNPWTSKLCCTLTVISGLLEPWIEGHRVIVSGLWLQTLLRHQASPWALTSPKCWPFTQSQALKSISLLHSGLSGLSGVASSLLSHSPFLDCCPCFYFTPRSSLLTHPSCSQPRTLFQQPPGPPPLVTTGPAGLHILTAMPCPVMAPQRSCQPCSVLKAKIYRIHAQGQKRQNMSINGIMYLYL